MPHIIVQLATGKTEQQKTQLVDAIVEDAVSILGIEEKALSVAIEEIPPQDWTEKVYLSEIRNNLNKLYKKPDYGPLRNKTR